MANLVDWLWRSEIKEQDNANDLAVSFARAFSSHDGKRSLGHLLAITQERFLSASANANQLYYLEGQRALVSMILSLIDQGRSAHQ